MTPICQGWARFDTEAQARYVAEQETIVQGTPWDAVPCGDHWHVWETGTRP